MKRQRVACAALVVACVLAGCASYRPAPLPERDALLKQTAHLQVDAASMPTPALRSHRFDPSDGLDITEVAMLAVVNNPELVLLRAEGGITRAQAFSAGLLPDPQLALTSERVLGSPPGATAAFSAGLTVDVGALLARSSARAAAGAETRKADLTLLWQEWQTVAKARLSFVKVQGLDRALELIGAQKAILQPRYERTRIALERGLITNDAATPQLTALQDLSRQANDLERQRNQARHDLNALLGVDPAVELTLVGAPDVPFADAATVQAALNDAARRRPDLLALQAGFDAEDARYRGALRAQFPALTLGPTRARDTSDVNTAGLAFGITLPIFNRNRGNIAIELATREKLRTDYQQRLDSAASDAHRLLAEDTILRRQRGEIAASVDRLQTAADRARTAFGARNLDALTLTNAEAALLARQLDGVAVEQALWEQAIALQALTGIDLQSPAPTDKTEKPSP